MSILQSKIDDSIARIRQFVPPEGYWVGQSGGKDSAVLRKLCAWSGVKCDLRMGITTVDPPEVIKFVREYQPDVIFEHPKTTMWKLILKHKCPPTRRMRYCCKELKEVFGNNRRILTGIRWQESRARSKRQMVEHCLTRNAVFIHPLIDWTEDDIWEFIRAEKIPYCSLYDEGFKRLGCIMCPQKDKLRRFDIARWPKYVEQYIRTFDKMLVLRRESPRCGPTTWQTGEEVFNWWVST